MTIHSTLPWRSADAGRWMYLDDGRWAKSDITTYDDQAQIELCLSCKYADDCHDCLGRAADRPTSRKRKNLLETMIRAGAATKDIVEATGLSRSTIIRRRKQMQAV